MNKNKNKKIKNNNQNRFASTSRGGRQVSRNNLGLAMYKSPRDVMPNQYDTKLKYMTNLVVTNVGAFLASSRYTTNAYDVDPSVGSTAMPGFTEFAGFYARFRTLAIKYKFSANNMELFPLTIIHGFSNSSIASGAVALTYAGNPLMVSSILGPLTGQGRGTFQRKATVVKIAGTAQPLYDDIYTGSTTSSTLATAGTKHCYFAVVSPVLLTAAGVYLTVEIELTIRFYLPNWLLS